jgi:hypothetical protein
MLMMQAPPHEPSRIATFRNPAVGIMAHKQRHDIDDGDENAHDYGEIEPSTSEAFKHPMTDDAKSSAAGHHPECNVSPVASVEAAVKTAAARLA